MDSNKTSDLFDAYYFDHGCGRPYARDEEWLHFFGSIADRIVSDIQPTTVLDAGCAWGLLVETLRKRGVDAFGVDISSYAIQHVHPDIQEYCWIGSVVDLFPQKYDLIICIEVLEHMPKSDAEQSIKNFCEHSDSVLFSSTPFDYKEATHLNVQPPEYWAELFARCGFFRDVDFEASFITPWAVRFCRKNEPVTRLVREYERKMFLLWKENSDLRDLTLEMRDQISQLDSSVQTLDMQLEEKAERLQMINIHVAQLEEIQESRSWKLIQVFQKFRLKLMPLGSRRDRLFSNILRSLSRQKLQQ